MQYTLLCYLDEKRWQKLGEAERNTLMTEHWEWTQAIVKSGHYRTSTRLKATACSTTLRVVNGKRATADGPFAETREQLGGFCLIECKDLDEALAIAARMPALRVGGAVEVRPVERLGGT